MAERHESKSRVFQFRLTESEHKKLKRIARASDMKASQLLRKIASGELKAVPA